MASNQLPPIRWGILGTGWVSTRFAADLLISRSSATAHHKITALGTSSQEKGAGFLTTVFPSSSPDSIKPKIYTNYGDVYIDPEVDIVYIGTPHSYHKEQCLAAIAAGKHVLCEKPFTINAAEAEEVVAAAKAKGVYVMEAVWTRFFPLVLDLKRLLHSEKIIGDIQRLTCDFSLDKEMETLPASHRYKDINLGGGALLDIGVYPLMWSSIVLDGKVGTEASNPEVKATLLVIDGVDHEDVVVMKYPAMRRIGILTGSLRAKGREEFLRVEGSKGVITVSGPACSLPRTLKIQVEGEEEKVIAYDHEGYGFYFEADAVAKDVLEGRKESSVVPLAESVRMMKIMDEIRRQGGVVYPQDE
ncbi:NAD(P)-binding protein [Hyaloscypha variabilis F]|uniref:D-xylose 1-dehydrogenase (NADP(+), D-xylono-1,5-lactone-forming) n=1 Tax=Hyaloscypha variabilis (strain UAMH 11265 / GT02V1 / F) TaxID=1149755 RepID=A0A2J6R6U5_HYAVF|nr:NAD(P)-binding protein [Hyaloscypha variabilis F]